MSACIMQLPACRAVLMQTARVTLGSMTRVRGVHPSCICCSLYVRRLILQTC